MVHVCLGTTPALQRTMMFARVRAGEVNRAGAVFYHASGKPINVARVLRTLGEKPVLCTPLGGAAGDIVREELKKTGIDYRGVETDAETRTCITLIDKVRGDATELVEEAERMSRAEIGRLKQQFLRALTGAKMVVLSGSLAPGITEDFYADCCAAANGRSVPVILDGRGEALLRALNRWPLVVKPNRDELSGTLGKTLKTPAALRRAMRELCGRGAQWAIITMGREGAVVSDGKAFWEIPAIKIKAISPIGSGDAFAAGLSCAIGRGSEVPEACRLATACAAANALVPGAGLLRMADVRKLLRLVRIRRI
jgi:tagatose 6-phosphate kinase